VRGRCDRAVGVPVRGLCGPLSEWLGLGYIRHVLFELLHVSSTAYS